MLAIAIKLEKNPDEGKLHLTTTALLTLTLFIVFSQIKGLD